MKRTVGEKRSPDCTKRKTRVDRRFREHGRSSRPRNTDGAMRVSRIAAARAEARVGRDRGGFEAPESSERRPIHTNRLQGLFRVGTAQATGGEVATEQRNRENVARPRLCVPEFRAVRPSCGRDFGASDRKAKKERPANLARSSEFLFKGVSKGQFPVGP